MLKLKVIGAGAAGNKAAISLIGNGFNKEDITLINSTAKDIPEEYTDNAIIFGAKDGLGGCGKERDLGKRLFLKDLKNGFVNLDNIADPDTSAVVIVSSTEGGSGSAATPIIAKYMKEVVNVPVIVALLFGFNTDVRGMQNSIEICQELQDSYGVIGISNAKCADATNGNILKAEQMANQKFVEIIDIISGRYLQPGSQNIDDTDLYKLLTTPGYMVVETNDISKIKNQDQYNKIVQSTIDESILVECTQQGAKRIGVIYHAPDQIMNYVDMNSYVIKDTYGIPYEMFTHVQSTDKSASTVTWISTGMPMPIAQLQEIYDNYLEGSAAVNKNKDSFFDSVAEMKGNQIDSMFNMLNNEQKEGDTKAAKVNFFAEFDMPTTKSVTKKTKNDSTQEF